MKEEFDFYNMKSLKSYNLDEKIRYQLSILDGLDAFTRKHCENVANLTCRLCEYLNMDEGFTIYCTICAYLHDVGKIFIPPAVLQKPGKLNEEEYQIMKTHTIIGYKMCVKDEKLRPYAAGTLYHHEALNGTGYPNGVTAKDIPYEAQIIRVADEFDAITSKRQYKTHVGTLDTLKILINETKPESKPKSINALSEKVRLGKIDKKIVKALFKVCYDDVEYEIAARTNYIKYLENELKRLEKALKSYKKMSSTIIPKQKDYYRQEVEMYLVNNEKVELIPELYEQTKKSLVQKREFIKKLYFESKEIKHLSV